MRFEFVDSLLLFLLLALKSNLVYLPMGHRFLHPLRSPSIFVYLINNSLIIHLVFFQLSIKFSSSYLDLLFFWFFFILCNRITQVDHQVGLVQKILCDKDELAHQNSCHLLEGTICHLLQHCGDPKHRFSKCEYDVDISAVAPSVISFAWAHRWLLSPTAILLTLMVAFAIVPELLWFFTWLAFLQRT